MAQTLRRRPAALALLGAFFLISGSLSAEAGMATARTGHSATLLPSGNILIVGGYTNVGTPIASVEISLEQQGTFINGMSINDASIAAGCRIARSSHTATLLPNGKVLVTGGSDGAAASNTALLYDATVNTWACTTNNMAVARQNHTATLLKTGSVLICGGNTDLAGTVVTATCDTYDPATGLFAATDSMGTGRAGHSASLITDGRVFITGGYDPARAASQRFIVNSEIYDPSRSAGLEFSPTHSLTQGRAFHTATAMGNGKILIAGGYNNFENAGNRGILETSEIFDPFTGSMIPAAAMPTRNMRHTAVLDVDGTVKILGGLGNITTTYLTAPAMTFAAGSYIQGVDSTTFVGAVPGGTNYISSASLKTAVGAPSSSTLLVPLSFQLAANVTGFIEVGEVLFSTPQAVFPNGWVYFFPGTENAAGQNSGIKADLAGAIVKNGEVSKTFHLKNVGGYYGFTDFTNKTLKDISVAAGCIAWAGGVINNSSAPAQINSAGTGCPGGRNNLDGQTTVSLPIEYLGATITSGTFALTAGSIVKSIGADLTYNIALTNAFSTVTTAVPVVSDGQGGAKATFNATWTNIEGTVAVTTTTSLSSPVLNPATPMNLTGITGTLKLVVDKVDMAGRTFTVDVATVVIRSMVLGNTQSYDPKTDAWSFAANFPARYGQTATLVPNGSIRINGGVSCETVTGTCASQTARSGIYASASLVPALASWTNLNTSMQTVRANHTATPLPNGSILVAGGSNGPSVLQTAELFNPVLRTFAPTGSMVNARDLHTATLLPNGKVLAAGGFSANAVSSGSTNTAEIYYPDNKTWVPTAVMISSRDQHTAVLLPDGNVLAAGGFNSSGSGYLDTAEIYYSTAGVWRSIGSTGANLLKRARASATLLQTGEILFVGGINENGVLGTAAIFNYNGINPLAAAGWRAAASLPGGRVAYLHTATLLPGGSVLVTGGSDGNLETNTSFVYDPAANTWSATSVPLNTPRYNHTATLLPNGTVLVAGGARTSNNAINEVESFDAGASSWTGMGALASKRTLHTTLVSQDGTIFNLGGYNGSQYQSGGDYVPFSAVVDDRTTGAPPSIRKSSITFVDSLSFSTGGLVSIQGKNFMGLTEASGGSAGSANSSHFHPRLYLQSVDGSGGGSSQGNGGFIIDLTTRIYNTIAGGPTNTWTKIAGSDVAVSSISILMPAASTGVPAGWYHLREVNNGVFSDSVLVHAGPPQPSTSVANLVGVTAGISSVTYTWTYSGVADGYSVYSATTGIFLATTSAQSFAFTGLDPNRSASIKVAPFTMSGDGPLAASNTSYSLTVIATNVVTSSVGFNSLTLSWSANGNSDITVYEVSYSTDDLSSNGQNPFTTNVSTPVAATDNPALTITSVTLQSLSPNTTYYFRVRAFNGSGIPSAFSSYSSATTRAPIGNLGGNPCNNSSPGLCEQPGGTTCINWTWTPQSLAIEYRIYNSTTNTLIGISSGAGITASFNDTGLSTNTARAVYVTAVTAAGEGPLSGGATVYTCAAPPLEDLPTFPEANITTTSLTMKWQRNANPQNTVFELTISTNFATAGSTQTFTSTANTNNLSIEVGGLSPAEVYVASVAAYNFDTPPRRSAYLNLKSTSTLAAKPASLNWTSVGTSEIGISWAANGNSSTATYQVTYSTTANFSTTVTTAIAFSSRFSGLSTTITGLNSNQQYHIKVAAQNIFGQPTGTVDTSTSTSTGGALTGSLAKVFAVNTDTRLDGTLGNGRYVSLYAPANTFSTEVTVTISSLNLTTDLCTNSTNVAVNITIDPPQQPTKPVYLTLKYTNAELGSLDPDRITLKRYDPVSNKCVPLQTTIDTVNKLIIARLNHFSAFQLGQVFASETPDSTRIFPNPFRAGTDGFVTFENMPAHARVRIFTLRGDLVYDRGANASGLMIWTGLNQSGRSVASGIYMAVIESFGNPAVQRKVVKLVVLR